MPGNTSEGSLNFRSTVRNYVSGSRPVVFVPNPKNKINESKRGKKIVCEALIDVEPPNELLRGSCFVQILVVLVCFCT